MFEALPSTCAKHSSHLMARLLPCTLGTLLLLTPGTDVNEVQKAAEPRAEASGDLVFVANKVWLLTSLLNDRISAEKSGWNCDALGVGGDRK